MKNLVREELIKTLNYTGFRVIMILHFCLMFAVILSPSRFDITVPGFSTDQLYHFPNIWSFIPWVASWFNILLTILVIILVCNEFSFRTFRQGVISGRSREQLFYGKSVIVLFIAAYATLLLLLLSVLFGFAYSDDISFSAITENMHILLVFFLQITAYMIFGMFIAVLFRNTALSIVLFFVYRLILEPVIRWLFPQHIRLYFPFKAIANLTPTPEFLSISSGEQAAGGDVDNLSFRDMGLIAEDLPVMTNVLLNLGYLSLFVLFIILLLRKRDL